MGRTPRIYTNSYSLLVNDMKRIFNCVVAIFLCVISSHVSGQNQYLVSQIDQLKFKGNGKVKSDREFVFDVVNQFGDYSENYSKQNPLMLIYDKNENLVLQMSFFVTAAFYKYDDKNNLIEISVYESPSIDYGDLPKLNKSPRWDTIDYRNYCRVNNLQTKVKFKYDNNNYLLEQNNYNQNGLTFKLTFKYNDKGNILNIQNYGDDFSPTSLDKYIYSDKGKLVELIQENGKTVYTYDPNGNMVKESLYVYSNSSRLGQAKFRLSVDKFFKNGLIIKQVKYDESQLKAFNKYEEFKYDDHNNEVFHSLKSGSENYIMTSKYSYDNLGNWIKRTDYKNDIPISGIRREIAYQ